MKIERCKEPSPDGEGGRSCPATTWVSIKSRPESCRISWTVFRVWKLVYNSVHICAHFFFPQTVQDTWDFRIYPQTQNKIAEASCNSLCWPGSIRTPRTQEVFLHSRRYSSSEFSDVLSVGPPNCILHSKHSLVDARRHPVYIPRDRDDKLPS